MKYRHTQIGGVIVMCLLATMTFMIILPFQIDVVPLVLFVTLLILAISLPLFYSLNVEISHTTLLCRFGIGIIRRRIPLSDIQEVRAVKNPWYAGWGIRWMPGQYWLWNVSGFRGLELLLKNGSRFRIGTDEPEVLVQVIQTSKASAT